MDWIIVIPLFVGAICVVEGILLIARRQWGPNARAVRKKLDELALASYGQTKVDITRKKRFLSNIPGLDAILSKVPILRRYDRLVMQADVSQPLAFFLLLSPLFFLCGGLLGQFFAKGLFVAALFGSVAASFPFFYLLSRKHRRTRQFESQLPEALDLMARSLKAGHAFSGGLQSVAEEFGAPIGSEFRRAVNEINYGGAIDQALKNMTERVEVDDLKFFTVSVIIQRESGGNLAEILESIATVIRERFKLQGKIQTLSAEGKLSGAILVALPFLVAISISFLNPGYLGILGSDPLGKMLVAAALLMMGMGILIIKKMIVIKV